MVKTEKRAVNAIDCLKITDDSPTGLRDGVTPHRMLPRCAGNTLVYMLGHVCDPEKRVWHDYEILVVMFVFLLFFGSCYCQPKPVMRERGGGA